MKKILALAGSNSTQSINAKLLKFTIDQIYDYKVQFIKMADLPFPMYSEDEEKSSGFKNSLIELHNDIREAEGLLIAVNEHNGSMSAYFKNVLDWLSRFNRKFLDEKNVFILSTSNGIRGGIGALEQLEKMIPRFGGIVVEAYSLPKFSENFSLATNKVVDKNAKKVLEEKLNTFLKAIA
ncbi:NADPH-dependent FMN reductase [Zhouia sp. PK063]|uniref:NADPH-dependent FMN reductase n=1 Tax=Zhouia sp. PK063 TaxID=3373602 RepID=UPI0037B77528